MIIKTLMENTTVSKDLNSEHGLSLYIETKSHNILFDVGASRLFLDNAQKLNVDITDVGLVVISHGHYDHGGGLRTFLKENTKAEVFLHNLAFEKHYALRPGNNLEFIGLEEDLKQNSRFIFTEDQFFISNGIQVFSNITPKEPPPVSNRGLLKNQNDKMVEDTFLHEQNLIIEEDGKTLLLTGCAHNGIVNIIEHFHAVKGYMPDYVIGGFHLSSRLVNEDSSVIQRIGRYLVNTKAKFYTCHCTGIEPYKQLKSIMGENIDYISTGSQLIL